MYADDTTLYYNVNQNITAEVINGELLKINQWLGANKLSLNLTKTKFMVFHMHNKSVSILGQNPPGQIPQDKTPRTIPRWKKNPDGQNPPVDKTPLDKTPPDKTPQTKPPDKTPSDKTPRT